MSPRTRWPRSPAVRACAAIPTRATTRARSPRCTPESNNVNCAFAPAVLSPQVSLYTLPGAVKPAVWIGENWRSNMSGEARRLAAIAETATGTGVFSRQTTGPWSLDVTIPGKFNPRRHRLWHLAMGSSSSASGSAHLAASVDAGRHGRPGLAGSR